MLDRITPVILTRDEEPNIGRTLEQLRWAREVIVLDSMSTDSTESIVRGFPNTRLVKRPLTTLADQWTAAVSLASTEWVLTLDADYFVPATFTEELTALSPREELSGYSAAFDYAVGGRCLRGTLYTPRLVLLRMGRFSFYQDGHTQRPQVNGPVDTLTSHLVHDDRKPLSRFIARQRIYMRNEAGKLRTADPATLNMAARLRKLRVVAPFAVLLYTLFGKGLILDGVAGLRYAFERFLAESFLSWELLRGEPKSIPAAQRAANERSEPRE